MMADESKDRDFLVRKVFNYICGSGGFSELSHLLRQSSPLKNLIGKNEQVKNWLRVQAQTDRRFVLIKNHDGDIFGVRIDLRKKICPQYWAKGSCGRPLNACKYWHVCKRYIEGTCLGNCSRSHDFHNCSDVAKTKELEIDQFPNNNIRSAVAWSLPQVCLSYLKGECQSDKCPYLHICPDEVRGNRCNCVRSHQLTDAHNDEILKRYDLNLHPGMKLDYVRCNILVLPNQKSFSFQKCESKRVSVSTSSPNMTSKHKQDESKVQNSPELSPSACPSQDSLLSCAERDAPSDLEKSKSRGRTRTRRLKNTSNQTKTAVRKMSSGLGSQKDLAASVNTVNDLGNSLTSAKSRNVPSLLNIQGEEGGYNSDSDASTNSMTSNASNAYVNEDVFTGGRKLPSSPFTNISVPKSEGYLRNKAETASPLAKSAEAPADDEKPGTSEPSDSSADDWLSNSLFECLYKEYECSAPFFTLKKRKDLCLEELEDANSWFRSRTDKFIINEDETGNITVVTAFCPRLRFCFEYVNFGYCTKKTCQYFHLCKKFITGRCDRGEKCEQNHHFQNEPDKSTLSELGLGCLTNEQLRQLMRSSAPQVCNGYNEGKCAKGNACSKLHICTEYVDATCEDGEQCRLNHEMGLETEHAKSFLRKFRLERVKTEQVLKTILVCEDPASTLLTAKAKSARTGASTESTGHSKMEAGTSEDKKGTLIPLSLQAFKPPLSRDGDIPERTRKLSVSSSCSSIMDLSENLPSKKAVFECICKEYNGCVSFPVISKRQDLFPQGFGDVAAWFTRKKESFLIDENQDGSLRTVTAICRRARLCFAHSSYKTCSRDNCQYLHACRAYVAGYCRFGSGCCMEHNFKNEKNTKIISKLRLDGLTDKELRRLVQLSSPQVCDDYNCFDRLCPRGDDCPQVHICKNFVRNRCNDDDLCTLEHESALKTTQAIVILDKYGIKKGADVSTLVRMLFVSDKSSSHSKQSKHATAYKVGKIESASTRSKKLCTDGVSSMIERIVAQKIDQDTVASSAVPQPTHYDFLVSSSLPAADAYSSPYSATDIEPSETKVFENLCKDYDCSVPFSVVAKREDLFPRECQDIEYWFRKWKSSFLITENSSGTITQINAFSARARLCLAYINSGSCMKKNCNYLHMCRDYITDNCTYGATCKQNHTFSNEKDKTFLASVNLIQFTNEQLRKLVLCSTPQACQDYNSGFCERGVSCPRIHVCKDFLRKTCQQGYRCDLEHESAMDSYHTQAVLERYYLGNVGSNEGRTDVLMKMILVCDGSGSSGKISGHVHQNKPDAPICSDFLLSKCKKGRQCLGHHCSRPFHWQYSHPCRVEWTSFSEEDSETLEKVFCDPAEDECELNNLAIWSDSTTKPVKGTVHLEEGMMHCRGTSFDVRRLSTKSYVIDPSDPLATKWTWYWKDEFGVWSEYSTDTSGTDLQRLFEETFVKRKVYAYRSQSVTFSTSQHDYELHFTSSPMFQKNLTYRTTRVVKRRPLKLLSHEDLQEAKRQGRIAKNQQNKGGSVPGHWSPMPRDEQVTRVKLASTSDEYERVETLFRSTIDERVRIVSIERVQNPFMWEKYCRKKENMAAVKNRGRERKSVNEKQLFHGTSPDNVAAICKQNFDWRLHGKNATAYGEGSYFAANASYSHNYTKESVDSCRYMFVATVLVGSYARGQSSFRRPPPINPRNSESDLYDSCVDDVNRPTIFVVFDTDQFYPAYVIKYSVVSHKAPVAAAPQNPAYTPRSYAAAQSPYSTSSYPAGQVYSGGFSGGCSSHYYSSHSGNATRYSVSQPSSQQRNTSPYWYPVPGSASSGHTTGTSSPRPVMQSSSHYTTSQVSPNMYRTSGNLTSRSTSSYRAHDTGPGSQSRKNNCLIM